MNTGYDNEQLYRRIDELQEQNRALLNRVNALETSVANGATTTTTSSSTANAPSIVNYVDNGDFGFNEEQYETTTYVDDDKDAARWYTRNSDASGQFTEHTTGTQSPDALTADLRTGVDGAVGASSPNFAGTGTFTAGDVGKKIVVYGAGTAGAALITTIAAFVDATHVTLTDNAVTGVSGALFYVYNKETFWDKTQGLAVLGGKKGLAQPLIKNLATPGAILYARFQVRLTPHASLDFTDQLRVSIWDNTSGQEKIVEAQPFDLEATPAVASPGAFSRKYILRVDTTSSFFYSDVLTPVQVNNQVSVDALDNTNFVQVRWQGFAEAARYRLYRYDSEHTEWRLIADITNGANQFQDKGGRSGELFTPPVANVNPKAEAIIPNFGTSVSSAAYRDVLLAIRVPSLYQFSATTNKQWFRIDITDDTGTYIVIPPGSLLIDKVALGYTNGRWSFSAKDLTVPATVVTTDPPPLNIPGGNDNLPDEGGGVFNGFYGF